MCTGYDSPTPCADHTVLSRRGLLKAAGAAVALASTGALAAPALAAGSRRISPEKMGYQLYSARDQLSADTRGTLGALRKIGFTRVEHAGYAGGSVQSFGGELKRAGIRASSGHTGIPFPYDAARFKTVVAEAKLLGQRAIVEPLPSFALPGLIAGSAGAPVGNPAATWRAFADTLNQAGEEARKAGISVGYHNHNVEFLTCPDDPTRNGYDVLLAETDPALVHFEMDIYWVTFAGKDPVEILRKHPRRIRQLHVKDMAKDGSITAPGKGVIDFTRVFKAAADSGARIEGYIIEQDNAGASAFTTAKLGIDLLRRARF